MQHNKYLLVVLVFALGCGGGEVVNRPDTYVATGIVTYSGAPLAGASVTFRPKVKGGKGAVAITNENGEFELMTFETGDGALAGDYTVTVIKQQHTPGDPSYNDSDSPNYGKEPPPSAQSQTIDLLPNKYGDPKKSGLVATVQDGENFFTFELSE